eukprot:scaffold71486_cov30-Tisochrysis_lutea.AAC.1
MREVGTAAVWGPDLEASPMGGVRLEVWWLWEGVRCLCCKMGPAVSVSMTASSVLQFAVFWGRTQAGACVHLAGRVVWAWSPRRQ